MKKIIVILILLGLCKCASAQDTIPKPPYTNMTAKTYLFKNHVMVDSLFFLGVRDTLVVPIRAGAVVLWQHASFDTVLWFYNGFKWDRTGVGGGGATYTVDNGLTASTATNFQLGGELIVNTSIPTTSKHLVISGISADYEFKVQNEGVGNAAYFVAASNPGATIENSSESSGVLYILKSQSTASTNTVIPSIRIERLTSGTADNGIGTDIDIRLENASGASQTATKLTTKWLDASAATSQFIIDGVDAGSDQSVLTINGDGSTQLNRYGSGSFTGTPTFNLSVDASGNIIETTGGTSTGLTRQIITSGTSATVTGGNYIVTIDPASTLATYTLTLPASPSDLDIVQVDFGGTVTSGMIVTALTISPNSGQTILDNTAPTSATTDNTLLYRYRTANTKWYRFKP